MSVILNRIIAQSLTMYPRTVALSPESVTVLLYAMAFLDFKRNWLDEAEDPLDEITTEDWDEIEELTATVIQEVLTPMIGYCFPVVLGGIPDNCLALDGGIHNREDYPQLYDLIDSVFVLDADRFFLPDTRSRVLAGAGQGTGLLEYSPGQQFGEEGVSLSENENGPHAHTDIGHTHTEVIAIPSSTLPGEIPVPVPVAIPGASVTGVGFANIQSSGLGTAHENRQPSIALYWAVVAL